MFVTRSQPNTACFQLLKRKGTVQHFKGGSRLQAKMTASIKKQTNLL